MALRRAVVHADRIAPKVIAIATRLDAGFPHEPVLEPWGTSSPRGFGRPGSFAVSRYDLRYGPHARIANSLRPS
jgi:hypothetical protein